MESTPGKGAVNMVEMTTQDLVCYISLVDKPGADLRDWLQFWKPCSGGSGG